MGNTKTGSHPSRRALRALLRMRLCVKEREDESSRGQSCGDHRRGLRHRPGSGQDVRCGGCQGRGGGDRRGTGRGERARGRRRRPLRSDRRDRRRQRQADGAAGQGGFRPHRRPAELRRWLAARGQAGDRSRSFGLGPHHQPRHEGAVPVLPARHPRDARAGQGQRGQLLLGRGLARQPHRSRLRHGQGRPDLLHPGPGGRLLAQGYPRQRHLPRQSC